MMVAARKSSNLPVLLLAISAFILGTAAVKQWERLSEEDEMKLDLQLRNINKPAVKSFKTEYGDILDCIDIYKQLAFDHPLLKNHTIQMKPISIPRGMESGTFVKEENSVLMLKNIGCPKGYVIVKRTTREDLLMAKHLSARISNPANTYSLNAIDRGLRGAGVEYRGLHYGAKANINVWSPSVSQDQFSAATVWITKGVLPQFLDIQAGWIVYQYLYKNYSRLYTYWTADGYQHTGCFNILCPGFIQVSTNIPLGIILRPVSTYNGLQYQFPLAIFQDNATGNWWLGINNESVGYWPKDLLPDLSSGASYAAWGGQIYSPLQEPSPAMGSGHFPREGFKKSAFMNQLKIVDYTRLCVDPNQLTVSVGEPRCFNVDHYVSTSPNWQQTMYYGGPAHCTN